jgi:cyclophilin family peptidyl-prolyl cis-trans isomerase
MKPVLAILGLAVAFIVVSLLISTPRDLKPNPQDAPVAPETQPESSAGATKQPPMPFNPPMEGKITAELKIKNVGPLTVEFYPKAAPKAVEQISGLIKKGFYDGIIIHRVDRPVVIQFGNPVTKEAGVNAPETDTSVPMLKFEQNDLTHVVGAIGLARLNDKDTATSQLFIDLQPMAQWNGEYCVIGRVVGGMDLLDKVKRGDAIESFKIKS